MADVNDVAAAAAVAGAAGGGEFKTADAVAVLTEHGADPKSLENVPEADLKSRYEGARTIAEKATAKAAASSKAPEKYEPFKVAGEAKLDEAVSTEVSALAKEFGLSQDKAQKLYDSRIAAGASHQKQLTDRISETHKSWQEATRADKEFGGEKLTENLAIAKAGAEQFATPELSKLMDATGLGDHPEVIRVFFRIGKHFKSDTARTGARPQDSAAVGVFSYPNSKHA